MISFCLNNNNDKSFIIWSTKRIYKCHYILGMHLVLRAQKQFINISKHSVIHYVQISTNTHILVTATTVSTVFPFVATDNYYTNKASHTLLYIYQETSRRIVIKIRPSYLDLFPFKREKKKESFQFRRALKNFNNTGGDF